ncbi:probable paraquat-inducible protein A [Desulfotalea psychrophila LSv54]|uniref:Probable paraquat-inducible protein A n=1 Tax=Desulfotalea psychrophila (strain LSv54 / DSM 12343) TaxID=177439 RepID=Q6AQF5_DESPS|nr:probable paraquat-inducible protein A [Desulfotalea psychrophila LSv54]
MKITLFFCTLYFNMDYFLLQLRHFIERFNEEGNGIHIGKESTVAPQRTEHLMACKDCDLLVIQAKVPPGYSAKCPRCGRCLDRSIHHSIAKVLAHSITGILLYLPAIFLPLLTFEAVGFTDSSNVIGCIIEFYQAEYYFVTLAIFLSAIVFPCLLLLSALLTSLSLYFHKYPPWLRHIFRIYVRTEEWAMTEVFFLGIIVAIIKMKDSSTIGYDAGFFCFMLVVLITVRINATMDKRLFWERIEFKDRPTEALPFSPQSRGESAAANGFCHCHDCHKLIPIADGMDKCPRCGAYLHLRKQQSISRTWALLCSAIILLFPANLLPIMQVSFMGTPTPSTIMDGIRFFFDSGQLFIGIVILTASILVPIFKVVGITILLISIKFNFHHYLRKKAIMYRYISFIGKWSMLDIFVIGLLTALVNFGFFSSVSADSAATYFCGVVLTTMAAALAFDPRLLWDKYENTAGSGPVPPQPPKTP